MRRPRHRVTRWILGICCLLSWFIGCDSTAIVPPAPPDEGVVRQLLQQLEERTPEEGEAAEKIQQAKTDLRETLKWLAIRQDSLDAQKRYQKFLQQYPQEASKRRAAITALQLKPSNEQESNLSIEKLKDLTQQAQNVRQELQKLEQKMDQECMQNEQIAARLTDLPELIRETKKAQQELEQRLAHIEANEWNLVRYEQNYEKFAAHSHLAAEWCGRSAQIATFEKELSYQSKAFELSYLALELLELQLQQKNVLAERLRRAFLAHQEKTIKRIVVKEQSPELYQAEQYLNSLRQKQKEQQRRLESVGAAKRKLALDNAMVNNIIKQVQEQAQWLSFSPALGEAFRNRYRKLPEKPKLRDIDTEIARRSAQSLEYQAAQQAKQQELRIRVQQPGNKELLILLRRQEALLRSLVEASEQLLLELTQLAVSSNDLIKALDAAAVTFNRYLFWVPSTSPISFHFPMEVARDIALLFPSSMLASDWIAEINQLSAQIGTSKLTFLVVCCLVSILIWGSRRKYYDFLIVSSSRIGKVTQDQFSLTMKTILWGAWITFPAPFLMFSLGFILKQVESNFSISTFAALGKALSSAAPALWGCLLVYAFAEKRGLFIEHFRWPSGTVLKFRWGWTFFLSLLIPLLLLLTIFNELGFPATLGRLTFFAICTLRTAFIVFLMRLGVPLHLDKGGVARPHLNLIIWTLLLAASPVTFALSGLGYLSAAITLLFRVEISAVIWCTILGSYDVIRRWMLIQRRRIAFERAKQRRADILAQRARLEEDAGSVEGTLQELEEPVVDLDTISARSLQLVRYVLGMIALGVLFLLWSELNLAFSFVDNVEVWEGKYSASPVTLGSLLIAMLVLFLTTQLVQNLPALLELAILQHLDLSPGTGYAITMLTKYSLTLIGSISIFSLLGFDLGKLQIAFSFFAAGIGFGLRDFFASFFSGLIMLFTKFVRIGDTITSGTATGTVTKINVLSTTMMDWDHKEVLVPNKVFLSEVVLNWTLSDAVTRIILKIPAEPDVPSSTVISLLEAAALSVPHILDIPAPEIYLLDLEHGYQMYELRVYVAEMSHRNPIRSELHQQILARFQGHGLSLPSIGWFGRFERVSRSELKK